VLERVIEEIEREDGELDGEGDVDGEAMRRRREKRKLAIVDCCSGAGGPMPAIEKKLNQRRTARSLAPIPVLLSDIHPHLPAWARLIHQSPTKSLSYAPYPVDATHTPGELKKRRHLRTFCLAFHHFDEDGARRVLEDAMRTAEGICIIELQEPTIGSMLSAAMTGPWSLLFTPFQDPNLRQYPPLLSFTLLTNPNKCR